MLQFLQGGDTGLPVPELAFREYGIPFLSVHDLGNEIYIAYFSFHPSPPFAYPLAQESVPHIIGADVLEFEAEESGYLLADGIVRRCSIGRGYQIQVAIEDHVPESDQWILDPVQLGLLVGIGHRDDMGYYVQFLHLPEIPVA